MTGSRFHYKLKSHRLEPAVGHSDGAEPTGIKYELSTVDKEVPLPLSGLPGVLFHVEWLVIALQHPELGVYHQYPRGTLKLPPQVLAIWEPSPSGDDEHLALCL